MAETREIAEIKDKFTGDINELRDKKVATATDASSAADVTSNLKFLLLNGTNGEFETALKSYVDEAVRQALGTLVSGIDKGTGASKILATDSSNDLGTITPANLATQLGVDYKNFGNLDSESADVVLHVLNQLSMTSGISIGHGGWFNHTNGYNVLINSKLWATDVYVNGIIAVYHNHETIFFDGYYTGGHWTYKKYKITLS